MSPIEPDVDRSPAATVAATDAGDVPAGGSSLDAPQGASPVPEPVPAPAPADRIAPPAAPGGPGPTRRQPRRPRPIFLLVGVVLATALGIGLFTGVGTSPSSQTAVVGGAVPAFSLSRLGGGAKVSVPADGGSAAPAILVFFASWCGPCQHEVPALASTYHRQQEAGSTLAKVAVIGIDDLDPTANALKFVHQSGVTFPVGVDKSGTVTNGLFQLTGLPDAVFVEANGTIAAVHEGALSASGLVSWERKLLKTA